MCIFPPCTAGIATLRLGSRAEAGSGSGCGRRKDTCRSTAALLRPYTLDRTPCGHLLPLLQRPLPPPRRPSLPTEFPPSPEDRKSSECSSRLTYKDHKL